MAKCNARVGPLPLNAVAVATVNYSSDGNERRNRSFPSDEAPALGTILAGPPQPVVANRTMPDALIAISIRAHPKSSHRQHQQKGDCQAYEIARSCFLGWPIPNRQRENRRRVRNEQCADDDRLPPDLSRLEDHEFSPFLRSPTLHRSATMRSAQVPSGELA